MSENEIRVLYVQPGKYPEERTIPNTLRALQELVGGDIECCRPWRDSVCVICNDSGKIDGLPPNRLYGHTDFLAGSFVVCGNGGEDFISLTDRQVFLYERLYHMIASAGISLMILALYGQRTLPADLSSFDLMALVIFLAGFFVLRKWKPSPIKVMAGAAVAGVVLYSITA